MRPAFEIIKTLPDVSTVSSIFLMCLADRVLAYGDCAIVPDPTAEELADIAVSSARTAAQFGIDPRVAMLSYSTGTSGAGVEVEKVRRRPNWYASANRTSWSRGRSSTTPRWNRRSPRPRCRTRPSPAGPPC